MKQQAVGGWICKFRRFILFYFLWRSSVPLQHQEILLQTAPLCFLSLEILWRRRTRVLKQGVCIWKRRSAIHFQLSGVQKTCLWWGPPLPYLLDWAAQILPTAYLTTISLSSAEIQAVQSSFHLKNWDGVVCVSVPNQVLKWLQTFTELWNLATVLPVGAPSSLHNSLLLGMQLGSLWRAVSSPLNRVWLQITTETSSEKHSSFD